MTRFFKTPFRFSRDKTPTSAVHFGAFGKHPAWPEHIIGLANEDRLVWLKDTLYERGIRANIDSGEWKRLEDASEHQPFAHLLLWHHPDEIIIGRLWESSDFNGRTRYPMVVCAVCYHLPLTWVIQNVAPALKNLEQQCQQIAIECPPKPAGNETTRIDGEQRVCALIEETRRQLEQAVTAAPITAGPPPYERALALIADCPDMGPGRKGLYNLAFHVQRVMGAYRANADSAGDKRWSRAAPQRLRVPRCANDELNAVSLWLRLLLEHLDPTVPILLISPIEESWLDIVLGNAGTPEFTCLRASTKAMPLTTQIPYPVESELTAKVDLMVDADAALTSQAGEPAPQGEIGDELAEGTGDGGT